MGHRQHPDGKDFEEEPQYTWIVYACAMLLVAASQVTSSRLRRPAAWPAPSPQHRRRDKRTV